MIDSKFVLTPNKPVSVSMIKARVLHSSVATVPPACMHFLFPLGLFVYYHIQTHSPTQFSHVCEMFEYNSDQMNF